MDFDVSLNMQDHSKKDWYNNNAEFPESPRSICNHNWLCFDCRIAVRRQIDSDAPVCPECGSVTIWFGNKYEIPSKSNIYRWNKLRKFVSK